MKKIAIIGANSFQNRLILKAKALGYETHVFAWAAGDVGERTADYFYPISIAEKEKILEECRRIRPDAVCSIASDLAVLTVNFVARELGLTANPASCDYIATNKYAMRAALREAGLYTPRNVKITQEELEGTQPVIDLEYPVIVKPTDRSGSRAITKLESPEGLAAALREAIEPSFEKAAIVEEYIDGKEFSCESISYRGQHTMLAITEKFTTGAPKFIETAHIEPAPLDGESVKNVWDCVSRALDALHIENGAAHAEFRVDARGRVKIIEIGARMGGGCIGSDLVQLSTGYDFVKMVLDVALGNEPDLRRQGRGQYAGIRFLMDHSELDTIKETKDSLAGLVSLEIETETEHDVVDCGSRYGFFIVTGETYDAVKDQLTAGVLKPGAAG